ncbi:MAG: L,D-transpeptidase family protein [Planctomycetes bacterium]|nr:L,D-transpeptidase family protein [Planctomycetota bacterium]
MARRRTNPMGRFIVVLILLAACGWVVRSRMNAGGDRAAEPSAARADVQPPRDGGQPVLKPVPLPQAPATPQTPPQTIIIPPAPPAEAPPAAAPPEKIAEARQAYDQGCTRQAAGNLVEARRLLSRALASGLLAPKAGEDCRTRLKAIAATLVFSREIHPDDPYSREYRVKGGDVLERIVEREKLYVPWQGIARINRIDDPSKLQLNQRLKLVTGPFDAIITKHAYTLDLYHHGMFVTSFRIGLGQNGSTPTGRWLVRDRVPAATWTPPAGSDQTAPIECGQPGYPLGRDGLWIALQGLEQANEMVSGFGIHGTDEPDSIGRQASLGCIRLGDADIALLFDLLYRGKSTVEVRP